MSPPINHALAVSSIRFRDHLVGSALGTIGPIPATIAVFPWWLA